jgi:hypothetical protein
MVRLLWLPLPLLRTIADSLSTGVLDEMNLELVHKAPKPWAVTCNNHSAPIHEEVMRRVRYIPAAFDLCRSLSLIFFRLLFLQRLRKPSLPCTR